MPQPTSLSARRRSGDLIDAVVDNMRRNVEALKYATLAPSRYTVYLSAAELARLEGILPRLRAEAIRALDEELDRHNRPSWLHRRLPWLPASRRSPLENAGPQWHVEFRSDTDGELAADGDILVHSDLVLPPDPELGLGERTRRFVTMRTGEHPTVERTETRRTGPSHDAAHARLRYRDDSGDHEYAMTAERMTIGRGGRSHPVDLRVTTADDVSREHARIRRDAATGQYFLTDLSSLGTTIDGRHVPRGVAEHDGVRRETGAETALPSGSRIGLAETVFLEFVVSRA